MLRSIAHRLGVLALVVSAQGCNAVRAEDPEQVDRAWQARLEEAHAYAARKASQHPMAEATAATKTAEAPAREQATQPTPTRGATPSALLAARPAPTTRSQPRVTPQRRVARPRTPMTLEVVRAPGGDGPKTIEIGRSATP